jgi:hypothetical protein
MGTMEVSSKKLDLNAYVNGTKPTKNREKCHSIWIGVLYADSPRKIEMQKYGDGRLIVNPPRSNGLRIKQQSFRNLMEPFVWNTFLRKIWTKRTIRMKRTILLSAKMIAYNLCISLQPPHHRP